jgi:biopolymer transport protein ExbD
MLKHQSSTGLATRVAIGLAAVVLVCLTFTGSSQQTAPTGGAPASPQSTNLVVKIDAQGNYTLGQTPVTIDQLRTNLMAESAKQPKLRLEIQADKSAPLKAIVKVMDLTKEPGIGGVTLDTAGREKAPVITVEQLLSSPDRFDGARVVVTGFLLQPKVGDITIHQTEPDYHHYQRETGIRLDLDPNQRNLMPFQLKRGVVRGTFHAKRAQGVPSRIGEITSLELAQ